MYVTPGGTLWAGTADGLHRYDAHIGEDGTLTLAIGDATGHGAKAGTMVTATKSLFTNYADEPDPALVLDRASEALRRVGLPKLCMAFVLVKLRGREMELAGAGMPPAIVWRARTGEALEVPLKGIPLGGPNGSPYRSRRLQVGFGDTVVLMSDGLPELRNAAGDELGYDRMAELVCEVGGGSAADVASSLMERAARWTDGEGYRDDVTVLVLRAKEGLEGADDEDTPMW